MITDTEAERFAEWLAMDTGMEVHWHFPGAELCDEYVTGDAAIDHDRAAVTCRECIEWLHA